MRKNAGVDETGRRKQKEELVDAFFFENESAPVLKRRKEGKRTRKLAHCRPTPKVQHEWMKPFTVRKLFEI